ncbi:F0F1 ATP synthase subunit delta [Patescibacteria group bacterium]|nr:F0F1 ATP synthase subunit delta [Patescibacteria group bacterium]
MNEAKELASILIDRCFEASEEDLNDIVKVFVEELSKTGFVQNWQEIIESVDDAWKKKFGISKVTIVSAHPLTQELQKHIDKIAKGADLLQKVDERLMGGAVLRIDDTRIDGTITGKLRRLKMKLMQQ